MGSSPLRPPPRPGGKVGEMPIAGITLTQSRKYRVFRGRPGFLLTQLEILSFPRGWYEKGQVRKFRGLAQHRLRRVSLSLFLSVRREEAISLTVTDGSHLMRPSFFLWALAKDFQRFRLELCYAIVGGIAQSLEIDKGSRLEFKSCILQRQGRPGGGGGGPNLII